jgi:hypothetical protein
MIGDGFGHNRNRSDQNPASAVDDATSKAIPTMTRHARISFLRVVHFGGKFCSRESRRQFAPLIESIRFAVTHGVPVYLPPPSSMPIRRDMKPAMMRVCLRVPLSLARRLAAIPMLPFDATPTDRPRPRRSHMPPTPSQRAIAFALPGSLRQPSEQFRKPKSGEVCREQPSPAFAPLEPRPCLVFVWTHFTLSLSMIARPMTSAICGTMAFPRHLILSTLRGTP